MHSKEYEFSAVTLGWLCYPMFVDIVANIVCWWLFKLVPVSIPFHSIALHSSVGIGLFGMTCSILHPSG